jgi:hypothetical protein
VSATAWPNAQIVAPSAGGKVIFEDKLREGWTPSTGTSCRSTLGDGGLILSTFEQTTSYCAWGMWGAGSFDADVRLELTMRLRQGPADQDFGLAFGLKEEAGGFYTFSIVTAGSYRLDYLDDDTWKPLLEPASDAVVKRGLNVSNRLAVEINGRHLRTFVNGKLVGEADGPGDIAGAVGLYLNHGNMEAVFSDLRVTGLPARNVELGGERRTIRAAKKGANASDPRSGPKASSQAAEGPQKIASRPLNP